MCECDEAGATSLSQRTGAVTAMRLFGGRGGGLGDVVMWLRIMGCALLGYASLAFCLAGAATAEVPGCVKAGRKLGRLRRSKSRPLEG